MSYATKYSNSPPPSKKGKNDDSGFVRGSTAETFKNVTTDFAHETTAHGIRHATTGSYTRRVIWCVAVIGAFGFLVYTLVKIFIDYNRFPFRTAFKILPKSQLKFPAVTICNLNKFEGGRYQYSNELARIHRIVKSGPLSPNQTLDDLQNVSPYDKIFETQYGDLIDSLSPTIEETFLYCAWADKKINCKDHINYILTPIGRCFQFNQNDAKKSLRPGSKGGFTAILDIKPELYTTSEHGAEGARIILHDQYDYPEVFARGILASPGFQYYISFLLNSFQFLPYPFKAFGDGYCTASTETDYAPKGALYSGTYSMKACIYYKASAATFKSCGCKPLTCTVFQYYKCYKPQFEQFYEHATTSNIFACAFPCAFAFFDPVISSAKFPSDAALPIIWDKWNMTGRDLNASLVEVSLFFEDFVVRESEHVAIYDNLFSILATLGGNMSLFLGASLLTFGELLELIIRYASEGVFPACRKSKVDPKKQSQTDIKTDPESKPETTPPKGRLVAFNDEDDQVDSESSSVDDSDL